ncbi:hypothetical protein HBI56_079350 [Parastagonospora nodorum]|uniref:Uncharacterized protein n=2 Tax=Phaeosphaeria nodorum (strain SN15 / ATCC MYA-4574 / FGSC 10173) TaxID=321614 RepID=Q0UBN9_PHANO|nr:hypothetical protein SNOG_10825 [Parastagonospora nodorum SN15]KAH3913764.1 hypothetical protein HBH56_107420 [Parastagonospora nodorum]EAT82219.1 hypothetical protein SNOG_10825 [Parastagonospora nodorum SN15]KAH3929556.1 hypothetical protein HBH54_123000 [Parastagonospora nodorum]KAH3951463.1 hypothetical protein HBH53_056970 [Parastagonospora nodorum]KAH3975429.1 hypothetical protein HBH52_129790 [Parastagonospora nodorum]
MKFSLIAALASIAAASPLEISKRQSTSWQYSCGSGAAPSSFKAFNLGSCTAQLTLNKDRYIGVQWAFEATYADGTRAVHAPFRGVANFGVSDAFYPLPGNNFLTALPGNSAFTAVHEFANVCKGGQAPVSWRFYTTSANSACSSSSYRYTSGQIPATNGAVRPAKVSGVVIRRANNAGDFTVTWAPVANAVAYSVIVQYPTGTDEIGRPYTNVRGARVQGATTRTIATTTRRQDVQREAIVHAVNSQGVWSLTTDVQPVAASW